MSHDLVYSLQSFAQSDCTQLLVQDAACGGYRAANAREVLAEAQRLLARQMSGAPVLDSPTVVRDFVRARLGMAQHEVFALIFVNSQFRVIDYEEMFRGTLTSTSVYPREIVKEALQRNSGAVIAVHNHPSGNCEPSQADMQLTKTLRNALELVDVRLIDHLVVTAAQIVSFAERGLL